jgi:hypothetical protein
VHDAHRITLIDRSLRRSPSVMSPESSAAYPRVRASTPSLIFINRTRCSPCSETADRLGPKRLIGISEIRTLAMYRERLPPPLSRDGVAVARATGRGQSGRRAEALVTATPAVRSSAVPNWTTIHAELKWTVVMLRLAWIEYKRDASEG